MQNQSEQTGFLCHQIHFENNLRKNLSMRNLLSSVNTLDCQDPELEIKIDEKIDCPMVNLVPQKSKNYI